MAELTDAEFRAWLKAQQTMPVEVAARAGGGSLALRDTIQTTTGCGGAGVGGNASPTTAVRARPKKCYYCGRADGTHVGGCDVKPTDEEFRAAVREQARRDAIRMAAKPIDLVPWADAKTALDRFPLKIGVLSPIRLGKP